MDYTVKELSVILGVSEATIRRWIRKGKVKDIIKRGPKNGGYLISSKDRFIMSKMDSTFKMRNQYTNLLLKYKELKKEYDECCRQMYRASLYCSTSCIYRKQQKEAQQ